MKHNEQQQIIVVNITTELFNEIIEFLRNNGWKLVAAYNDQLYDKEIDFEFYQFKKDPDEILLTWDNWCEGEMKTTKAITNEIARHLGTNLQSGNMGYLHQEDIMERMHPLLKYYS